MSKQCEHPILVNGSQLNDNGKRKLQFISGVHPWINDLKVEYGSDNIFFIPCGKCAACRSNYSDNWAVRCTLEAMSHSYNYFVTLTYDNSSVKHFHPTDLRKFIDRMEKYNPNFKYFACYEYGSLTGRVHWHLILFCDFEIDTHDPVKLGDFYHYHSNLLSQKWIFGLHDITPFDHDCAAYVAKYSNKENNYVFTRKEKRCFMSRNIGKDYFMSHIDEIIENGFKVYGQFGNRKYLDIPPSFYRFAEQLGVVDFEKHKEQVKDKNRVLANSRNNFNFVHEEDARRNSLYFQSKHIQKGDRNGIL